MPGMAGMFTGMDAGAPGMAGSWIWSGTSKVPIGVVTG